MDDERQWHDVEQHRLPHESDKEWGLKRQFLLAHRDTLPLSRLICLANCFVNVEMYGNRYPEPVMRKLNELTSQLGDDFQAQRKSLRERNHIKFVKSSTTKSADHKSGSRGKFGKSQKMKGKYGISFVKASEEYKSSEMDESNQELTMMETNEELSAPTVKQSNVCIVECRPPAQSQDRFKIQPGDLVDALSGFSKLMQNHPPGHASLAATSTKQTQPQSNKKSMKVTSTPSLQQTKPRQRHKAPARPKKMHVVQEQVNMSQDCATTSSSLGDEGMNGELTQLFNNLAEQLRIILHCGTTPKNPVEILHLAMDKARMTAFPKLTSLPTGQYCCELKINHVRVAQANRTKKKDAKKEAYAIALQVLSQPCLKVHEVEANTWELVSVNAHLEEPAMSSRQLERPPAEAVIKRESNIRAIRKMGKRPKDLKRLSDFIILQNLLQADGVNSMTVLRQSADFNKSHLEYTYLGEGGGAGRQMVTCRVSLDGCLMGEVAGISKQITKAQASDEALDRLRDECWAIQIKQSGDTEGSALSREELMGDIQAKLSRIPDSNIGSQLLKKMGWSGGGVGKVGNEGIAEPVSVNSVINREGLGLRAEHGIKQDFMPKIRQAIQNYTRSNNQRDLAFSADFDKEERAMIHRECQKLGLKTHSHGSGDNRYLIISRKRTPNQLLTHILHSGGETSKYSLIPPKNYTG